MLKKSKYIPFSQRTGYVLVEANDNLLKDYMENKKMLVICWASWCHVCTSETSEIDQFINKNPDKQVIIVSHDNKKEDIENYLKENDLKWFVIYDRDRIIRKSLDPQATTIPATYLLDKKGNVINTYKSKMTLDELTRFYKGESI
ncbi:Sporulation thiol-disulfide oxidoreductase A precursor [compost metagenome]